MGLRLALTDRYHNADGSHRWIAPVGTPKEIWDIEIHAHIDNAREQGGCTQPKGCGMPEPRRGRHDQLPNTG